ncbi:hypothetical protein GI374_14885 [Paracoccus sp. S-4012]|uniref:hypothetical protein n=1 Tax=Paracoccus sp. S-4012 TaxID=2665648 RepID=UPI0012B05740|nr:hypothetical protein [Paracoccus sp. S-4012]MRX51693.1 hypothetical protein [Paracoccus sp. S-4012]
MTPPHSPSRQQAEIAFAELQSQFLERERPVEELDAVTQARAENTLRLKTVRMARDLNERATVAAAVASRRAAKA